VWGGPLGATASEPFEPFQVAVTVREERAAAGAGGAPAAVRGPVVQSLLLTVRAPDR
jgi:hypothetical protein